MSEVVDNTTETDQTATGDQTTTQAPVESRDPNTRKIKLRRRLHQVQKKDEQGKPVLDDKKQPVMISEPVVMLTQASVPTPDGPYAHIELAAGQNEFEFAAGDAAYLLREHPDALEPVPDQPTKLKESK